MMTQEQINIVKTVYSRFIESESLDWTDLDENIEMCSFLSDKELIAETQIKIIHHLAGEFRCSQDHKAELCMAPLILEAAQAIVDLYAKTKEMHPKNRYILTYYLALSEMRMIYVC